MVRRDSSVLSHRSWTGVVGGEHQIEITVEHLLELFEVFRATEDVLTRVEAVTYSERSGCFGHQLHDSASACRRNESPSKIRLSPRNGDEKLLIDVIPLCRVRDDRSQIIGDAARVVGSICRAGQNQGLKHKPTLQFVHERKIGSAKKRVRKSVGKNPESEAAFTMHDRPAEEATKIISAAERSAQFA